MGSRGMLAIAFALAWAVAAPAEEFAAEVEGVSDGDTLTVLRDGRTPVKLRLDGIDCPATGQDFGSAAKQHASGLAFGEAVTVRSLDTVRLRPSV